MTCTQRGHVSYAGCTGSSGYEGADIAGMQRHWVGLATWTTRRKYRRTPADMDNVCEKIDSPQVIKIKGDLPSNPSNELHHLALGFPPVARA